MVKALPSNAGGIGSIPGQLRLGRQRERGRGGANPGGVGVCPGPNIPLRGRQGPRDCIPGSPGESGLVSRSLVGRRFTCRDGCGRGSASPPAGTSASCPRPSWAGCSGHRRVGGGFAPRVLPGEPSSRAFPPSPPPPGPAALGAGPASLPRGLCHVVPRVAPASCHGGTEGLGL